MLVSKTEWVIGILVLVCLPYLGTGVIIIGDTKRNNDQLLIQNTEQELSGFGNRFEVSLPVKGMSSEAPVTRYKMLFDTKTMLSMYIKNHRVETFLVSLGTINAIWLFILATRDRKRSKDGK